MYLNFDLNRFELNFYIMKKKLSFLSLLLSLAANAQDVNTASSQSSVDNTAYNKWSIELNAGATKPIRAITNKYFTPTFNPTHIDLGARYMLSPKFGWKLDFEYDKFSERDNTPPFESTYLRTSLQGVINLGRALNFETFTNTFGLLFHTGLGVSQLTSKDGFEGEDYMVNGIFGLTGQVKLSNRVALTADLSGILHGSQNYNFDGMKASSSMAIDGVIINITAGLTFYLGKNEKHADWVGGKTISDDLEKRVRLLETSLLDSDKDGVADLYDLEPNSITGVAVNTKGQSIDHNQNGVPDELESYLDKTYAKIGNVPSNNNIEELINAGYVNVYFDFNSKNPTSASLPGVGFIVKYLQNNPSKSADIIGYADEIGDSGYNTELSRKRAEAVKEIAVKAGIDASRLNVIANGEDASVNKNSKEARQIVRRVSFKVK